MKKVTVTSLLFLVVSHGFAQNTTFQKIIENKFLSINLKADTTGQGNVEMVGVDNVKSKSAVEKILFGDTNAKIEFAVEPPFEGAYGLRVVRDSLNPSFLLEVKQIMNWDEVSKEVEGKYPTIGLPLQLALPSFPEDIWNLIKQHNQSMYPLQEEERLKLYRVETRSIPISNLFFEMLYAKFVSSIDHFKAKELVVGVFGGGDVVTFRCIVEHEVWTLWLRIPQGDILTFADLCRQIISDATAGTFDEANYIKLLKK